MMPAQPKPFIEAARQPHRCGRQPRGRARNRAPARHWLAAASFAGAMTVFQATSATAQGQFIPCAELGQPLVQIPELVSSEGKLSRTIRLTDVTQRTNLTPDPNNPNNCVPQFVRNFKGVDTVPPTYPGAPPESGFIPDWDRSKLFADPVPGPTLRARVGDLVQLTFLNQVNPALYGDTIDTGDTSGACDESSSGSRTPGAKGYPEKAHEIFPNCFHGSSSVNIHFHGTHTNPSSTGDNVFLNIAPSPRIRPGPDSQPAVTADSVKDWFTEFFAACEKQLKNDVLSEWPYLWSDLPAGYRQQQEAMLKDYDADRPGPQKVWPVNEYQIATRQWPQYYIGGYPYCFRLPEYSAGRWPPLRPAPTAQPARPSGIAFPSLQMGQSPGTHWYHAHKHGSTTLNVLNGMTGAFIIEGSYDDDLNRNYGTIDVGSPPVPVQWARAQPVLVINELGVSPPLLGGGTVPLPFSVNGRLQPVLTMKPGEVQLWRIANTSSRSFANIVGPPAGFEWRQLAQDGVQFAQENYLKSENAPSFLLAPGNRVDLLVKAPAIAPSTTVPVQVQQVVTRVGLTATSPAPVTLMSVKVSGEVPKNPKQRDFIATAPNPPHFLTDIGDSEVKGTKIITFNSGPSLSGMQHTVDGKQFDGSTGASVLLGKVEEWKIVNSTVQGGGLGPAGSAIDHPFHIHINPFQVVEVFDPNEPLIDAVTKQPVLDPASGKPKLDPATGRPIPDEAGNPIIDPATMKPFPKYVFEKEAQKRPEQCVRDARGNPADWKPCDNPLSTQVNRIWWDVFPIPAGKIATDAKGQPIKGQDGQPIVVPGYFKMRSRFVDYPGLYVLHCHILAHEDRGMMTVVEVRPLYPPVRHH